ncbi:LysR substrate-binding domain-containing protein [Paralcaligenes ureilyticus]|uniref:DNA-binding transcriptional LysR family regulator n=1 Tax=Paralcaligenes ureilyticus TaxID=627131 RepID=A0A4R3MHL3_9BURK|nr:LysR substrate-binding domain-containing protein [Paralcaligenes ureilyticus]TCT11155.1 DNA-binding transcriptional LysR family regulator [Paralcaligenes ureilyticus]
MRNLDMDLLRTLVTIEKANTFSGAANELFKTQSAITQQMQRLESLLGFPLFEKKGRRRVLTVQGSKLAAYGRRLLAINDEAIRTIGQQPMEGDIRLGAPLDVADTILPPVLTHIARYAPKVRLEIRVDRSPYLMEALESGDIDLTISTRHKKELNGIVLRTSPTAWICAADYVHNKRVPLPLILADEPSIFRKIALTALEQTKLEWRINYLAPTLVGIKAAIRAGLGITARSVELLGTDMRVLGEAEGLPPLPSVTYYLWTRQDTVSPLTLYIYEMLKSKFEYKEGELS